MLKEFREFIARGNVIDLAVGIIIGAAFTAVVNSMVNDLINPIIGLLIGGTDFSNLFIAFSWDTLPTDDFPTVAAAEAAGMAVFRYGSFITAVINFLIIAWVVFLLVKAVNKARALTLAEKEVKQAEDPADIALLKEIRDELKARRAPDAAPPV